MTRSELDNWIDRAWAEAALSVLFRQDGVPHTRPDGRTIRRLVLACNVCGAAVTDNHCDPPIDNVMDARSLEKHDTRCRVADVLRRYQRATERIVQTAICEEISWMAHRIEKEQT